MGPFPNRLTADAKYFKHNSRTLLQPIQWHLSENPNIFSEYFITFPELKLNLEHFGKKIQPLSLSISEIAHSKKRRYLNA